MFDNAATESSICAFLLAPIKHVVTAGLCNVQAIAI